MAVSSAVCAAKRAISHAWCYRQPHYAGAVVQVTSGGLALSDKLGDSVTRRNSIEARSDRLQRRAKPKSERRLE
jgi:hypothetical protein